MQDFLLSDFDYDLPEDRIAQFPLADRTASRLLHVPAEGPFEDLRFGDIATLLRAGDLLVLNDTKVIKARLLGHKETGGAVEAMVERVTGERTAISMLRCSKTPKPGCRLLFGDERRGEAVTVTGRQGEFFLLEFDSPVLDVLAALGKVPLPPYITHAADKSDETRYQTVYARQPGAVAAPTAGLHFSEALLSELEARGVQKAFVTLHVGAGTFQPVRESRVADHVMHSELCTVSPEAAEAINRAKDEGRRVVCVGTTSLRTVESAAQRTGRVEPGTLDTRLFITPGFRFRVMDLLVTNFHLPKSTLVMLVAAVSGRTRILEAYRHAVEAGYRFFSYGDACLLERRDGDAAV